MNKEIEQCEATEINRKPVQKSVTIEVVLIDPSHFLVKFGYRKPKRIFHTVNEVLRAIKKEIILTDEVA